MCCSIPDNLSESEDKKKFQELEVERKKINERLEKLWHEFRKLYREVVVNKNKKDAD